MTPPCTVPPVVLVVGPTAVGKTELAVELASRLGGEVIGADSRQVYRGMDIGTAKPGQADRALVSHHLIDVVDPDRDFDAGQFRALALAAIAEVRERGRVPFVVGGSGFYVRALTDGLPELPPPDPEIRAALRARHLEIGGARLHLELASVDEASARRLHPNDTARVLRALEVERQTGRPLSSFRDVGRALGPVLRVPVDRPRDELGPRIAARTAAMWEAGWLDEVARLASAGLGPELKAMNALGYREAWEHWSAGFASRGPEASATQQRIAAATRQYVRRQRSWFRPREGEIVSHPERDRGAIRERVERALSLSNALAAGTG